MITMSTTSSETTEPTVLLAMLNKLVVPCHYIRKWRRSSK